MAKKPKKQKEPKVYYNWYEAGNAFAEVVMNMHRKQNRYGGLEYYYSDITTGCLTKYGRRFNPFGNAKDAFKALNDFLKNRPGTEVYIFIKDGDHRLILQNADGTKIDLSTEKSISEAISFGLLNYCGKNKELFRMPS